MKDETQLKIEETLSKWKEIRKTLETNPHIVSFGPKVITYWPGKWWEYANCRPGGYSERIETDVGQTVTYTLAPLEALWDIQKGEGVILKGHLYSDNHLYFSKLNQLMGQFRKYSIENQLCYLDLMMGERYPAKFYAGRITYSEQIGEQKVISTAMDDEVTDGERIHISGSKPFVRRIILKFYPYERMARDANHVVESHTNCEYSVRFHNFTCLESDALRYDVVDLQKLLPYLPLDFSGETELMRLAKISGD